MPSRTITVYGQSQPGTFIKVWVNERLVKSGAVTDELFKFDTSVTVHGSVRVAVSVQAGWIKFGTITATYPAIINGTCNGYATMIQPIRRPCVTFDGSVWTEHTDITVKQGETFSYHHMMYNGPSKIKLSSDTADNNVYLGDIINNINFEFEFDYDYYKFDLTKDSDYVRLKEFVFQNIPWKR